MALIGALLFDGALAALGLALFVGRVGEFVLELAAEARSVTRGGLLVRDAGGTTGGSGGMVLRGVVVAIFITTHGYDIGVAGDLV